MASTVKLEWILSMTFEETDENGAVTLGVCGVWPCVKPLNPHHVDNTLPLICEESEVVEVYSCYEAE